MLYILVWVKRVFIDFYFIFGYIGEFFVYEIIEREEMLLMGRSVIRYLRGESE